MELKVGDCRKITSRNDPMVVQEIIKDSGINMEWKWADSICPHCRKRIDNVKSHTFPRIEIIVQIGVEPENSKLDDVVVFGFSEDKKLMLFTSEKSQEVFSISEKFKHLVEV